MPDFSVNLREGLKQKLITGKSVGLENDTEYYYAIGQLARYFICLNRSSKKNKSLINPILNAKNSNAIKDKLMQYYKKYNYTITSAKANLLCKMVLGYETQEKVKQDMICMGYVDNNLILEKGKQEAE